jgi:metallo-beta-lactamase family protein
MTETVEEFLHALTDTLQRKGGNVIIPAFAVGRTQDILFLLADLTRKGRVKGLTLYIDSPLAAQATQITLRHPECFDEETRRVFAWREAHPDALRVVVTASTEESMALNSLRGGAIILAGSGMCEAGRIKHHLKHNLWRKESSIVIVGFQAEGTLGRRIVDGARWVRVLGEDIAVAADVYTIGGLSAHADRDDLLSWAGHFRSPPGRVFVAHGEESVSVGFAQELRNRFRWNALVPDPGQPMEV